MRARPAPALTIVLHDRTGALAGEESRRPLDDRARRAHGGRRRPATRQPARGTLQSGRRRRAGAGRQEPPLHPQRSQGGTTGDADLSYAAGVWGGSGASSGTDARLSRSTGHRLPSLRPTGKDRCLSRGTRRGEPGGDGIVAGRRKRRRTAGGRHRTGTAGRDRRPAAAQRTRRGFRMSDSIATVICWRCSANWRKVATRRRRGGCMASAIPRRG